MRQEGTARERHDSVEISARRRGDEMVDETEVLWYERRYFRLGGCLGGISSASNDCSSNPENGIQLDRAPACETPD